MSLIPHTCLSVVCDVCADTLNDNGFDLHVANLRAARDAVRHTGWLVTADGYTLCDGADDAHREAFAALMPPAPVMPIPGQLSIDDA